MYGEGDNQDYEDQNLRSATVNVEDEQDPLIDEERLVDSNVMLAKAYREMSDASQAMAIWSERMAEALDTKIAAIRREHEAAAEILRAQERYDQASRRIGQVIGAP